MKQGKQIILLVLLLAVSLSLAGCSSQQSSSKMFGNNGLPAGRYLVGGGFFIEYVAPVSGTIYWVEETTEKILEMKSMLAGDKAEFGSENIESEEVKQVLGIELKDAKFTLYFIPRQMPMDSN